MSKEAVYSWKMLRTDPIIATGLVFFKRRLLPAFIRFIRAEIAARHGTNEKTAASHQNMACGCLRLLLAKQSKSELLQCFIGGHDFPDRRLVTVRHSEVVGVIFALKANQRLFGIDDIKNLPVYLLDKLPESPKTKRSFTRIRRFEI